MELYSVGLKSLKKGGIDPATGLPTNLLSVGNVFKDSVGYTGGDVTKTEIFAEQFSAPVKVFNKKGAAAFVFQVMSTEGDTLKNFLGGTVVEVGGRKEWSEPDNNEVIEASYEMETWDGTILTIHRGDTVGKPNWKVAENGIWLTEITVTPLQPLIAGVAKVKVKNPATT
jgi:hypothetical protein